MRDRTEGIILVLISLLASWGTWLVPAAGPGDIWAGIVPFSASIALLVLSGLVAIGGLQAKLSDHAAITNDDSGTLDILILFAIAVIYQHAFL